MCRPPRSAAPGHMPFSALPHVRALYMDHVLGHIRMNYLAYHWLHSLERRLDLRSCDLASPAELTVSVETYP